VREIPATLAWVRPETGQVNSSQVRGCYSASACDAAASQAMRPQPYCGARGRAAAVRAVLPPDGSLYPSRSKVL